MNTTHDDARHRQPATCVVVRSLAGKLDVFDRSDIATMLVAQNFEPHAVAGLLADLDGVAASDHVPLLVHHGDHGSGHLFTVEVLKPTGAA